MKKLGFFIPAIIFTILYTVAALGGVGAIHPIVLLWLILFWAAGILLNKSVFWGGLLGVIPSICFIYMGTQDTGQIISETPIGVAVLFYYMVCIYYVYKKGVSKSQ